MKGNFQVRFLGEKGGVILPTYPTSLQESLLPTSETGLALEPKGTESDCSGFIDTTGNGQTVPGL